MRWSTGKIAVLTLIIPLLIAGCTKSEEEVLNDAKDNARQVFQTNDLPKTNYEGDTFDFYVPEELDLIDQDSTNVILEDETHTYIVFVNRLEDMTSTLNYEAAQKPEALLYKSFETNDRFGYIRIIPHEDDQYEIQVGVGGAKITTLTKLQELDDQASMLMKMARTVNKVDD